MIEKKELFAMENYRSETGGQKPSQPCDKDSESRTKMINTMDFRVKHMQPSAASSRHPVGAHSSKDSMLSGFIAACP